MLFPRESQAATTGIELVRDHDGFPVVVAAGLLGADDSGLPLLPQRPGHAAPRRARPRPVHAAPPAWTARPGAATGRRSSPARHQRADEPRAQRSSWSTRRPGSRRSPRSSRCPAAALRLRHTLTNRGADDYELEGLEVVLPVADHLIEVLDFTGRHERERNPQRHAVTDGLWLRESRTGRPGLGSATMAVLGTPGFSTTHGEVLGVHVAWSGNSRAARRARPRHRHHDRRGRAAASGRGPARTRRELLLPVGPRGRGRRRARRAGRRLARPPAQPAQPSRRASRWCSTSGRRSTSTTTSRG